MMALVRREAQKNRANINFSFRFSGLGFGMISTTQVNLFGDSTSKSLLKCNLNDAPIFIFAALALHLMVLPGINQNYCAMLQFNWAFACINFTSLNSRISRNKASTKARVKCNAPRELLVLGVIMLITCQPSLDIMMSIREL